MREMTPFERGALLADILRQGERLNTRRVAELTECSLRTAQRDFVRLLRVLPLIQDNGEWMLLDRVNSK